jgi:hypothetical protein
MMAMVVASSMPAFASPNCEGRGAPHPSGQHRAHSNADDRFAETGDSKYLELSDKHHDKEVACDAEVPPGEGQ